MSSEETADPVWLHVGVVGLLYYLANGMWAWLYAGCVALYYVTPPIFRGIRSLRSSKWYPLVRRALVALLVSAVFSEWLTHDNNRHSSDLADHVSLVAVGTAMVFPFWLVAIYLLGFPLKLLRWMRNRRNARNYAARQEEAFRMESLRTRSTNDDQRRRVDARAQCELLYNLYAPEIGERFPRESLDQFMATYLADSSSAEEVEKRGRELRGIIEQHRQKAQPTAKRPRTIQELAEWYLGEKQRVKDLPLDDELKQEHMVSLDVRYSELSQELLQNMQP